MMPDVADVQHPITLPEKPALEGLEAKWNARWEQDGTYRFDRNHTRAEVYSIDTPPPTVSGSLHVGHVFSFTHTDLVARFQRMRGKAVFYPMGWDDNGLPTERRVQNYYGVRCDPSLPYDPAFRPPDGQGKASGGGASAKHPVSVSRPNFVELCLELTAEDEKAFEHLWRYLGLSVDWSMTYATIGPAGAARVAGIVPAAAAARDCVSARGADVMGCRFPNGSRPSRARRPRAARRVSPHSLSACRFVRTGFLEIDTTRPELIPACVALVAHPDDERYKPLFGSEVVTPLFGVSVPYAPMRSPIRKRGQESR